jgi:AcrR family transcriptional regulator
MSPRGEKQNEQMREDAIAKILNAALGIFADYGYKGTTMKMIVETAGMSYGLVYHYFPSKEAVFRSLIDSALEKSLNGIKEGLAGSSNAWQKLQNLSALLIKRVLTSDSSPYFLIMIQALTQGKSIPGIMEYIGKVSQEIYETVVPVIIEAQKSGDVMECDPVALTTAYLSSIQGLSFLVFGGTGLDKKITPDILNNLLRRKGETTK